MTADQANTPGPSATHTPNPSGGGPKANIKGNYKDKDRDKNADKDSENTSERKHNGVLAFLAKSHKEIKALFADYERLARTEADASERLSCAEEIFAKVNAHATIEEEIFYPALRKASREPLHVMVMAEAEVEHATVKDLITQLQQKDPDDPLYDARVKVLGEYVAHHVREEEGEMFAMAEESDLDLDELGERAKARGNELTESTAREGSATNRERTAH